jgi:hypothetical protein
LTFPRVIPSRSQILSTRAVQKLNSTNAGANQQLIELIPGWDEPANTLISVILGIIVKAFFFSDTSKQEDQA